MRQILKPFNRMRRILGKTLSKSYIKDKLKNRRGKCKKCGKCCCNCKYLDKSTRLCRVYKNPPLFCHKDFPIDNLDKRIWGVERVCGYKFRN